MSVKYGLTIENQNLITEKAKSKKSGCYQFRGVAYIVRAGLVTHVASGGEVFERAGNFNVRVGVCSILSDEALRFLVKFARNLNK